LWSGDYDGLMIEWDWNCNVTRTFKHTSSIRCLKAFDNMIFSGHYDGSIIGWIDTKVHESLQEISKNVPNLTVYKEKTQSSAIEKNRLVLMEMSQRMEDTEWKQMLFVVDIPENKSQNFIQALDVFKYMMKKSPQTFTTDLKILLEHLKREDLIELMKDFK